MSVVAHAGTAGGTTDGDAPPLDATARARLLDLARRSIATGLATGAPLAVDLGGLPAALTAPRAAFVTLHRHGRLRGCIGHLEPVAPLACDVADNAFAAAFRDPRFPPLGAGELADTVIEVSVLSLPVPLAFGSEAELLAALRPGEDGLILTDGHHRGTFLPSVWAQLPTPAAFLEGLKAKAGLPPGYWSATLRVARYRTESFGEGEGETAG